jgi:hypothetical protein
VEVEYYCTSLLKVNKSNCISLFSTTYKILSNIILSRLSPCVDKFIGDYQGLFQSNRSTTEQFFSIPQTLEKNGSTVRQYISYSYTSRRPMIQLGGKFCTIFPMRLVYPHTCKVCTDWGRHHTRKVIRKFTTVYCTSAIGLHLHVKPTKLGTFGRASRYLER